MLFGNEKFYDSPNVHPSLLLIKDSEVEIICINKEVVCFINILRICSENIKKHITSGNYEKIRDEVYYNHNVPALIHSEHKGAIKYYLTVECTECRDQCSREMVASYEGAWEKVRKQFFGNKASEKLDYDQLKRHNFREIRCLTEEDEVKYLSLVEQRFWKKFHDWASKHLKK